MKILTGKIISNKNKNTLVVEVERFLSHKVYKKRFKLSKKYQIHTTKEHKLGETINFVETRPISKTKRWKVLEEEK